MPLLLGQLRWGWGDGRVTPHPLLGQPCVIAGDPSRELLLCLRFPVCVPALAFPLPAPSFWASPLTSPCTQALAGSLRSRVALATGVTEASEGQDY